MPLRYKTKFVILALCLPICLIFSNKALGFDGKLSYSLTYYIMGTMQEDAGNHESAVRLYKKALRADYENSVIHLSLASSFIKSNKIPEAIKELKIVASLDPDAVEPHALLALIYSSENKPDLAAQAYEAALKNATKLEPANIDIYKSLGLVYLSQRKFKEAQNTYKLILDLVPEDSEARFYAGTIYEELKDRPAAVKELKKAIEINPDYHQALNSLGYLYAEDGVKLDEAQAMVKKALEFEPGNGAYLDSLGWIYFKKEDLNKAKELLEKASSLIDDPVVFDHLADVYYKLGDYPQARSMWEKSLTLDSKQDKVKDKLEKVK